MSLYATIIYAVLLIAALVLMFSKRYKEGVLGHAGLAAVAFGTALTLGQAILGGVEFQFLPESLVVDVGLALLLVHMVVRYVLRHQKVGLRAGDKEAGSVVDKFCQRV